jgi:photosystem II stability/assembly factor-like uncharacterized protein
MVIKDFETELREALAHHAEQVPDDVTDRVIRQSQSSIAAHGATAAHRSSDEHGATPTRRRLVAGLISAVTVVLVSGLAVVHVATEASGRSAVTPSSAGTPWKLVADIGQPGWQAVAATDLQAGTLSCPTKSTCYAQGWASVFGSTQIEVTHDSGHSWHRWSMPGGFETATTQGLECVGADWCVTLDQNKSGKFAFFVTDDGGSSWKMLPGPSRLGSDFSFSDISCETANSCVALGGFDRRPSVALVTDDGWSTWSLSQFSNGSVPFDAQCFAGGECIAVGAGPARSNRLSAAVEYSTDGGVRWTSSELPTGVDATISSISCSSYLMCVAVAPGLTRGGYAVLVTTDGGRRWTSAGARGVPAGGFMGVACATSSDCWAPSVSALGRGPEQPTLYGTTDGGSSWRAAQLPPNVEADSLFGFGISCPDADTCFALGYVPSGSRTLSAGSQASPTGKVVLLASRT